MGNDMGWLPKRTALIVIDLQKGIVAMPTAPVSSAEVVRNAARLASAPAAMRARRWCWCG